MPYRTLDRRTFVELMAAGGGALLSPPWMKSAFARTAERSVRVRGRVMAGADGIAGARISDGLQVVLSGPDGTFEMVSSTFRDFVRLSVPSGFEVPQNATGTARFYEPIAPDAGGEQSIAFDLKRSRASDERHRVLLLADPQTQDTDETTWFQEQTVPDVRATVESVPGVEVFGVSCGDIMYDNLELYPEYERGVRRMAIPFFQVVGNHDMDYDARVDEDSTATFCRHFGPRYYSFDRGAVRHVVLDDVFWNGAEYFGYLDRVQLAWLEADLATLEPGRTVIVATHIPILGSQHVRTGESQPAPTPPSRIARSSTGCSSRSRHTCWWAIRTRASTCSSTAFTSTCAAPCAGRGGAAPSASTARRPATRSTTSMERTCGGATSPRATTSRSRYGCIRPGRIRRHPRRSSPTSGTGIPPGAWCGTREVTAGAGWHGAMVSTR